MAELLKNRKAKFDHKTEYIIPPLFIIFFMYTREGFDFSPLPSTKIAPSLSHSPLPVLPFFELHGAIRHNGAVELGSRIKKTHLLTTNVFFRLPSLVLLCLRRVMGRIIWSLHGSFISTCAEQVYDINCFTLPFIATPWPKASGLRTGGHCRANRRV